MCTSLTEDALDELLASFAGIVITASCTSKISGCVQLLPEIDATSTNKQSILYKFIHTNNAFLNLCLYYMMHSLPSMLKPFFSCPCNRFSMCFFPFFILFHIVYVDADACSATIAPGNCLSIEKNVQK